ncbi:MAG: cupredoxin domain-containing protein [Rhodothermia bacterium]|nr:MAG: cupredoxin domain-containing protein [Rhodothermia bacterium]
MTPDQWIVTAAVVALIALTIWFFWLKRVEGFRTTVNSQGYQEAMILVKGGYTPDTIIVDHGQPVRLIFRREESSSCSEMVVLPEFKKSAQLPEGETVPVEFLPDQPGTFEFTCQMGMLRGRLIVN